MGKASRRKRENRVRQEEGESGNPWSGTASTHEIPREIDRAVAFKRQGDYGGANGIYQDLNRKYPDTAVVLYSWAKTVAAEGRYEEAIELFERAQALYEQSDEGSAWQCQEHIKSLREAGDSEKFEGYMRAVAGNRSWIYRAPSSNPAEFVPEIDKELKSLAAPDFHSPDSLWCKYFSSQREGGRFFRDSLSVKIERYHFPFAAEEIMTPLPASRGLSDYLNVLPLESGYLVLFDSAEGRPFRKGGVPVHFCRLVERAGRLVPSKPMKMASHRALDFWQWAQVERESGKEVLILSGYDPSGDCIVFHNLQSGEEGERRDFKINRSILDLKKQHRSRQIALQACPQEHATWIGEYGNVGVLFFRSDRKFVGVDLKSETVLWQEEVEEAFYSSIYRDMLVSVREEYIEARSAQTGKIIVKDELTKEEAWCYVNPIVFGGNLYLSTDNGVIWEVDIPNPVESRDLASNLDYKLALENEKRNRSSDPGHSGEALRKKFSSYHQQVTKANRNSGFRCEEVLQFVHHGYYRCRPVVVNDAMFLYVPMQGGAREPADAQRLCILKLKPDHTASAVRWLMQRLEVTPFTNIASCMGAPGNWKAIEVFERSLSRSLFRCGKYYRDMRQKAFIDVYCLSSREREQFARIDPRVRFVSVESAYQWIYSSIATTLTYLGGCPDFEILFFCDRAKLPDLVRVDFERSHPVFCPDDLSERGKYLRREVLELGGLARLEAFDRGRYQSVLETLVTLPSADRACILEHDYFHSRQLHRNLARETGVALFQAGKAGRAIYYLFMSNCLLESEFDFDTSAMMPLMQAVCQLIYFRGAETKTELLTQVDKDYTFEVDGLPQDFEFFFGLPLGGERLLRRFEVINHFVAEKRTPEANELVQQALAELEEYLSHHENEKLQVGTLLQVYETTIPRLIGLNIDTGDVGEALRIFEAFKALILRRYLSDDNRKALLNRLQDERFYRELRSRKAKLLSTGTGERSSVPLYSVPREEAAHDQRGSLQTVNHGAGIMEIAGMLESLPPDAVLLEYYMEEDRQGVFLASKGGGLRYVQLSERSLERYLDEIENFNEVIRSRAKDEERIRAHLKGLYNKLLRPIEEHLDGCAELVIVPTKFLFHCPFTALFDGTSYLIQRYQVSISPSASIRTICASNTRSGTGSVTLVKGDDEELAGIAREESFLRERFGARCEVISSYPLPANVLDRTGIFHFSGHGTFDDSEPLLSRIQVGKEDSLSVLDLYTLDLSSVRLAVVNACVSGMSRVEAVDDIFGLVRGFFTAGCPTVINTLWNLPDQVAPVFAESFYSDPVVSQAPLAAFSRSIRRLIESEAFGAPQYWACYQYYGKGGGGAAPPVDRQPPAAKGLLQGSFEWLRGALS